MGTEIDLDKLERLALAATPGPWFVTCNCTGKTFYTIKNDRVYIGEALGVYNGKANAAYIVAACNSLPDLIAENRALRERVRGLERQRDFFLNVLKENYLCPYSYCKGDVGPDVEEWDCTAADNRGCWIEAAEQAAKEAGE